MQDPLPRWPVWAQNYLSPTPWDIGTFAVGSQNIELWIFHHLNVHMSWIFITNPAFLSHIWKSLYFLNVWRSHFLFISPNQLGCQTCGMSDLCNRYRIILTKWSSQRQTLSQIVCHTMQTFADISNVFYASVWGESINDNIQETPLNLMLVDIT